MPSASMMRRSTGFGFQRLIHPRLLAVADENLGDAVLGGEVEDGRDGVLGVQQFDVRAWLHARSQIAPMRRWSSALSSSCST